MRDWGADEPEWFEEIARVVGCALIHTVYALSAACAYSNQKHGMPRRAGKFGLLCHSIMQASFASQGEKQIGGGEA